MNPFRQLLRSAGGKPPVGDEDIRFLDGLKTEGKGGDQLAIIPAIAGG